MEMPMPGLSDRVGRVRLGIALALALGLAAVAGRIAHAETPPPLPKSAKVVVLGVNFENDNSMYEPTTKQEEARLQHVEQQLKDRLAASGAYTIVPVPDEVRARIDAGPPIGTCGGCEADYASALHADIAAWITIQKVSNLILNLNVYMEDVKAQKMVFVHSVDIRGNTDESWSRSLDYLMKNYLLPSPG
jgi:hypothetical protein